MKITEPGIYYDVPTADYLADPCPAPSLTQSIAKIILERSPLHAWHAHPRLNPDWKPDDPTKYDVGNIAHRLLIGRGKKIVVLPEKFKDWRTDASKEFREAALADGKHAVLGKHYALADRMVSAAREQLELRKLGRLFREGEGTGEVVTAWKEDAGFWCRQMIDWDDSDRGIFCDYKSTDMIAAPQNLARIMSNAGWPIQAAMAERGLNILRGHVRRRFLFVVQETDMPYCLNVVELSEGVLTMGRKMLAAAMSRWNLCMSGDIWPGYPTEIIVPEYPGYAEAQWLEREQTEFGNVLMAG